MKYPSPLPPMKHQLAARRKHEQRPRHPSSEDVQALVMEMGCGKSKVIVDEWSDQIVAWLDGDESARIDLLVVAPKGSVTNWHERKSESQPGELEAHLHPEILRRVAIGVWGGGATRKRKLEWTLGVTTRPRAMFVNVEALSVSGGEAEAACRRFLSSGRAIFALDESTRAMRNSQRTKALMRLREGAAARRILSGLITPKSPMDLFWQFFFLDPKILGHESYVTFRNRYAVVEKANYQPQALIRNKLRSLTGVDNETLSDGLLRSRLQRLYGGDRVVPVGTPRRQVLEEIETAVDGMPRDQLIGAIERLGGYMQGTTTKIKGFRNIEELRDKIAPYSYRVLKKDCLDLKPKIYLSRDVEMTDEQRRVYDEILRFATSQLDSGHHVTTKMILEQMIKLHQIVCGHVRDEDGTLRHLTSNRPQAVLDVLEEWEKKAVVWVTYDPEIRKIADAIAGEYGREAVAMFWGGNSKTRGDDERRFLSDPRCRFMCSTQATGGIGNNWTVASLNVYAANSYSLEQRMQSEDRTDRKGQTEPVTYVDLTCRSTVEEKIVRCLRSNLDLAAQITGENAKEWLI